MAIAPIVGLVIGDAARPFIVAVALVIVVLVLDLHVKDGDVAVVSTDASAR